MGTIIARKRKDGSTGYHAQVTIKRGGEIVHRETRTFDRRQAASAWMEKRETELAKPGAIERQNMAAPKLSAVIDRYIEESIKEIGRTKAQVLATIKEYDIADLKCSEVTSEHLVSFAKKLPVQPHRLNLYHCTAGLGLPVRLTSDGRCAGSDQKPRSYFEKQGARSSTNLDRTRPSHAPFRQNQNSSAAVRPDAADYRVRYFQYATAGRDHADYMDRF